MPRTRHPLALAAVSLLAFVATGYALSSTPMRASAKLLDQVLTVVALRFVEGVPSDSLYELAARGVVKELGDPYTELLTPADRASFLRETNGRYSGLGVLLARSGDGSVMVEKVYPGSPAAARGVREGDHVLAVDGTDVRGWSVEKVSGKLLGEDGTTVRVRFARPGVPEPLALSFTRAEVKVSSVPFHLMLADRVGYVPVTQFGERTAADVARAVTALQQQGATGLVLDLRGNPGGIVGEAFSLANLFLPSGKVLLSVKSRDGDEVMRSEREPLAPTLPLVVLVDGGSASASEIVAGALQDYDRALVLGTTSYGKGLVQSVYELEGGYALKITTGKWYTPSGRSIQKPRKLDAAGRYVEVSPDSGAAAARPVYTSAAGRPLFGGGAITPDVIVREDTLTTAEQRLRRALLPHADAFYTAVTTVAEAQRGRVASDFVVQQAWRESVLRQMAGSKARIDPALVDAAPAELDRAIEERVARLAFGDSTVTRRQARYDRQLQAAQSLLRQRVSQAAVFAAATSAGKGAT